MLEVTNAKRPPLGLNTAGGIWFGFIVYPFLTMVLAALQPGAWIGFAALGGFLILCRSAFLWNRLGFILLLPLVVYKVSSFISHLLIALEFYIPEIGRYGEADISPATYLVVTSLHFALIIFFSSCWMGSKSTSSNSVIYHFPAEIDVAFLFIFGSICYQITVLIYTGLAHGFPLITGLDRFVYRSLNADGAFIDVLNYKATIALLSSMMISSDHVSMRRRKVIGFSYLALFALYSLFGEKFHALLLVCTLFALPILVKKPDLFSKYIKRFLPIMLITLLLAIGLVYYVYSDYGVQTSSVTIERMFGRMAQQSQLWYISNRTFSGAFYFDSHAVSAVWESLFTSNADSRLLSLGIGSFYFILKFSPAAVQQSIYEMQGLNQFTQVSEAFWMSVAGLPGLFVYLLISSLFYSAVMVFLALSVKKTNFITTYLWGSVFVFLMTSMNQALPHQIFAFNYLRWYILAAVVHFGYHIMQKTSISTKDRNESK